MIWSRDVLRRDAARTALAVGRARLALTRLADLTGGALIVVLALWLRDARICGTVLALRALIIGGAFDALVRRAGLAVLAVLVGRAARPLRFVAARCGGGKRQEHGRRRDERGSETWTHGTKPKWTQHVSQIC